MSEPILMALLQLFAIVAASAGKQVTENARKILESYLDQHLNAQELEEYLKLFDELLLFHTPEEGMNPDGEILEKTKAICNRVRKQLTSRDRQIVFIKFLEFLDALSREKDGRPATPDRRFLEYLEVFKAAFNPPGQEFDNAIAFVTDPTGPSMHPAHLLVVGRADPGIPGQVKVIQRDNLDGHLFILHLPSIRTLIGRYVGNDDLYLNGHPIQPLRSFVISGGAIVKNQKIAPVYYADILAQFLRTTERTPLEFTAREIEFRFRNSSNGIHPFSFTATSGELIGVMGGSGVGKSTLLNALNGNLALTSGQVLINGHDLGKEREKMQGLIGFVPQDDLLIEELTVFQNLFYNAKLCFGDLSDEQVSERVLRMLQSLGLYETKDLKVGSPLEKTISGGQRKRLNIALELIREPSVLFVDEPTSGLSSRDSENIMDLLKELALKGRLVFVVIHQPSSDIFKLFDRLLLMDQEGHPVYYGDPVDAVVYFKRVTGQVNSDVGQCSACGNVNPEQIFNILEAKLVDEYGNETDQRRISPEAWNEVFRAQMEGRSAQVPEERSVPKSTFAIPGKIKQLGVYFKRDLLSKLANRQYVLINLLEAPVLAYVMAFFLKYYRVGHGTSGEYIFRENDNIPQYLFIAVIVALFLGLTVSAEEIIRDRAIRQREKFLDLSRASYLLSKVAILFMISAVQTLLFVLVGSMVLGIEGMMPAHWLLLFSTSAMANVLGLNVSASFNSAKVIYIMIPVLIIPQLLFSGIIVKFDKLHPWFASERSVPWIGNVMASRWAYEGLAVTQFMANDYERAVYPYDQRMKTANWKKDLWVREVQNSIAEVRRSMSGHGPEIDLAYELSMIKREIRREMELINGFTCPSVEVLSPGSVTEAALTDIEQCLDLLVTHYRKVYRSAEQDKESYVANMTATPEAKKAYFALLDGFRNESLTEIVTNRNDVNVIVEYQGRLVQKSDPVYLVPEKGTIFEAHFYAPVKWLFGQRIPTLWANTIVLWGMSLVLAVLLYLDVFPRLMRLIPVRDER